MASIIVISKIELLLEQLAGAEADGWSISFCLCLKLSDFVLQVGDLSVVLVYFEPVLLVVLERRLNAFVEGIEFSFLGV